MGAWYYFRVHIVEPYLETNHQAKLAVARAATAAASAEKLAREKEAMQAVVKAATAKGGFASDAPAAALVEPTPPAEAASGPIITGSLLDVKSDLKRKWFYFF